MRRPRNSLRSFSTAVRLGMLLGLVAGTPAASGGNSQPGDTLAGLKKEAEVANEEMTKALASITSESERQAVYQRCSEPLVALGRRALSLVLAHPDASDAAETLAWIHLGGLVRSRSGDAEAVLDAAYDLMADRFLDRDTILPVCFYAWNDAFNTTRAEAFLRAAAEKSPNLNVRALACFSLGRHQHNLLRVAGRFDDPIRDKILERNLGHETFRRVRERQPDVLRRDAEAQYERTSREFAGLQPMGKALPPLGELAEGALFRLRNLDVACTLPEIVGEDIDGRPMTLSEFRGKVVVIIAWATWCGPCMAMVPAEKELAERMKGRPFVLLGVNGDDDRTVARTVAAKEGITWRLFWDGGHQGPIALKWNISRWPTIYVVDAKGKIRDDGIVYYEYYHKHAFHEAFEDLVAEAEASNP